MDVLTPKYAVVLASGFDATTYHPIIQGAFKDIEVDGVAFKMVFTFDKYLQQGTFTHVFSTQEEYQTFLNSTQWQIKKVEYDWDNDLAIITLNDNTVHQFPCTEEWSSKDVIAALNSMEE